ncbi:MAG: L,D-transpeptidase family protein [Lachnospiraceae bacterium]
MRYKRFTPLKAMGISCVMLAASAFTVYGTEVGPGVEKKMEYESGIEIDRLAAAQEADQVIVVVGNGVDSSQVQVAYFRQNEDGKWQEEFYVPGYCGYNGMSAEKREGDRRTPIGTYSFTNAFGIKEDPGSILDYKVLDQHDYWVDDSNSKYYNQMVSTKTISATWKSAEHLIAVNPCYNYSLALNYNEACVPGMGSAIFLHGLHPTKTWTEGCIAIEEDKVMQLVQQANAGTKIVIVPDSVSLEYID